MNKSLSRLFEFKSLKNNYLSLVILAALLILNFGATAQYDSTRLRQAQNGYGFDWKNGKFQTLITGIDTPKMAYKDSGAIAYKGGKVWVYTGAYWKEPTASVIPTAYDSVTRKISGDVVWSGTGLVFNSNTITYKILGQTYTAAPANLTLAAADTILDRKDIIYVDNTGNIGILTGTPGSGAYPVPDPASQLQLIQIDIPADATVPGNISDVVVYAENIEWVGTTAISGGLFNYTGNPHAGTVSSYIPTFTNGQSIYYEAVPTYNAADYQYLKFWVRLNTGGTSSGTRFNITFGNSVIPASTSVVVMNGVYGLNGFTVNAWQEVIIPISAFVFSSPTFNRLTFRLTLASGDGFQLDDIKLQSGGGTRTGSGVITFNGRDGNVLPIRSDYPTDTTLISRIASDSIAANALFPDTNDFKYSGDTLKLKNRGVTDTALIKRVVSDTAMGLRLHYVTKSQADSLIAISALVKGSWYAISGVHATLYGGTTIVLQAIETNKFGVAGHGAFYNPVYSRLAVCDTSVASRTAGDTAVWGGYVWVCNTGGKPIATDILNLNTSWTKVAYDTFAYKIAIDEIEYDYSNDLIVMRHEVEADNIVTFVKSDISFFADNYGLAYNSIAVFMWGNPFSYFTNLGIGKNKIYNSYFETVSQINSNISSNTLTAGSNIYYNTLTASSIYYNTLTASNISSNTLTAGSNIYYNTLTASNISSNTLTASSIYYNTLTNSNISSNTLTAASNISSNTLTNSNITSNTLTASSIYYNTLTNSNIYSNTLTASSISSNTFTGNSNIYYNTLTNSNIYSNTLTASSNISIGLIYPIVSKSIQNVIMNSASINVDIAAATIIYLPIAKKVFAMPNGTVKIQYINNDNVTVTADINY